MPKMVEVPGYDQPVEFPDSMSNEDIAKVLQKQTKKEKAPFFAASHGAPSPVQTAPSHLQDPTGRPLKAPEIDPLTGRQKTAGRTMTEEETAKYRTGAMTVAGATVGSMGLGAAVAPMLAFSRAGAPTAFAVQAAARLLGAGLGGGGGEAYGQLFEHAHGVGPSSSGQAAERIGESAKDMAELEALGLGVEGASKIVAGMTRGIASKTVEALRKTTVYQRMTAAKAAAVTERNLVVSQKAGETAQEIANTFAAQPVPGMLEARGPGIVKTAEAQVAKNVAVMYEGFKQAVATKRIDYRDVAQMIVDIEKKTPRAKGGLSVMTEPDPAWRTFVDAMESGNKEQASVYQKAIAPQPIKSGPVYGSKTSFTEKTAPVSETTVISPGGFEVDPMTGARKMTSGKPEIKRIHAAPNSSELAPAVVDARGTISQRIADLERQPNAPREYVAGLKNALAALDTKLEGVASEVGPGGPELLKAAKQYFGASREIQKQAMYRLLKNGGDVGRALMDPGAPEGVAVLKAIGRETGDATIVPTAQRAVIEKLLDPSGKDPDLARFNDRLRGLGLTGEHLFSDPKAAKVIAGIKEQADVLNHLETVPRINGKKGERVAIELLTHAAGSIAGYEVGKDITGTYHGGWVGVALGASATNKMVGELLKLAENPAANKMFLGALKGIEKTGEVSGVATSQAARALRMVRNMKPIGEPDAAPPRQK